MFLNRDGVQLFYDAQGEGEPTLLFVHGWAMSHEVWREQVAAFSPNHRVVCIDLRGFGQSGKPEGEYTFELFADDLDFVIRELGMEKPILVGWSMGVSIALVYVAAHPDRLSKLVLVDGTPVLIAREDFPDGAPEEAIQGLLGAIQADFAGGMRAFVDLVFPEPDTDQLKNWVHSITQQTTPAIAVNSMNNSTGPDLRPLLKQITVPTLILYGELDQACSPAVNRYMHAQIANSEIHEFPGKGHAPFLTDAEAFNQRLGIFVSQ